MTIEAEGAVHPETAAESPAEASVTGQKGKSLDELVVGLSSADELKPIDGVPITEAKTGDADSAAPQKQQGKEELEAVEEEDVVKVESLPDLPKTPTTRFWARWFKKGSFTPNFGKQRTEDTEMCEKETQDDNQGKKGENHTGDENHKESKDSPANGDGIGEQGKNEGEGQNVKSSSSSTDITIPIGDADTATKADEKQGDESVPEKLPLRERFVVYRRKRYLLVGAAIGVLFLVTVILVVTALSGGGFGYDDDDWSIPVAATDCGLVEGHIEEGAFVFRGIPYALPPVGEHRWKPPRAFQSISECWSGTKQVHKFAPRCPQKKAPGVRFNTSEDCLYLNVYTPSMSKRGLRPVLVVLPGGSLMGMGEEDIFLEPSPGLARTHDAVVVTFEYRRNAFGFLSLDLLSKGVRPPTSGNYGFLDQVAVLKWVQRNIRQFNGDPNKVVVFGHGAGATSALLLATSTETKGLLSRVWATGASVNFPNQTVEEAARNNLEFLANINCTSLTCLHQKTADEVIAAVPMSWYDDVSAQLPRKQEMTAPSLVVVDGVFIKDFVYELWASENFTRVPIVIGSNLQEFASRRVLPEADQVDSAELSSYVRDRLGTIDPKLADKVLQMYVHNDTMPAEQLHTMISDVRVTCPLELLTGDFINATEGARAAHFYIVDYSPNISLSFSTNAEPTRLAQHGLDVAAIFGKMSSAAGSSEMHRNDLQFEHNLQKLFHSFAHAGTPSLGSQPLKESPFVNYISANVRSRASQHEPCASWEEYGVFPEYAKKN
ncbi:fumonisin B1 esterase-like isoform X1 [Rhipicephalus microplus]|uniref:fumonisin B1 esterase-like isoform X1 n=2 Tax=Rhipicephalus microplus TaxID=6941 RepID=UPI003F6B9503